MFRGLRGRGECASRPVNNRRRHSDDGWLGGHDRMIRCRPDGHETVPKRLWGGAKAEEGNGEVLEPRRSGGKVGRTERGDRRLAPSQLGKSGDQRATGCWRSRGWPHKCEERDEERRGVWAIELEDDETISRGRSEGRRAGERGETKHGSQQRVRTIQGRG